MLKSQCQGDDNSGEQKDLDFKGANKQTKNQQLNLFNASDPDRKIYNDERKKENTVDWKNFPPNCQVTLHYLQTFQRYL